MFKIGFFDLSSGHNNFEQGQIFFQAHSKRFKAMSQEVKNVKI